MVLLHSGSVRPPLYTDNTAVVRLDALERDRQLNAQQYLTQRARYDTPRRLLTDVGLGIIYLAISYTAALRLLKIESYSNMSLVQSPKSRWVFMGLLNATWLGLIPAYVFYYCYTAERGDYASTADSMGIPIFGAALATFAGIPIVNLVGIAIILRGKLPASLTVQSQFGNFRTVLVNSLFSIALLFAGGFWSGVFLLVPLIILAVYLVLSSRAILLR